MKSIKINKQNGFKNIFISLLIFIVLNMFAIFTLGISSVYGSFLLNILIISLMVAYICKRKFLYFESTLILFYVLFFIIAPIFQLKQGYLPNTFPINNGLIIRVNIYLCIFLVSYNFFRFILLNKNFDKNIYNEDLIVSYKTVSLVITIMFLIVLLIYIPDILKKIIFRTSEFEDNMNKSTSLIINKYFFMLPFFLFTYYLYIYKNKFKNRKVLINLVVFFLLFAFIKNPFLEKRNAIGPLYLTILFYLNRKKLNTRKFLLKLLILFIIFFPASTIITHSEYGLRDIINGNVQIIKGIMNINYSEQFNTLHYDAWSNFIATVDFVKNNGITKGHQLLGSMLFFIPRNIWNNKPESTGIVIGNYLINYYGMWFNNLSNPFPSEGYINFGLIGMILFALVLAKLGITCKKYFEIGGYYEVISFYITFHLIFLMRGDLMNGIAYLSGVIFAIHFTPKIIDEIIGVLWNKEPL
ncbi:hypothetical protein OW763_08425 [Clostridium aestuarii]|uniref:O-antigen polysaccharide polymerase Wzy n=1 Tax=Clostridium aestuarii TaxID=338193 RepID=A0ABT4CZH1_9CLOT|nr:hypothetical protein [Clostridium aestuarii]MCY6484381.1 hypothetical protein [Clostridium aestuarii]